VSASFSFDFLQIAKVYFTPMWRDGTYFPLLFSRKAVEEATEKIIRIVPEQKK
jgi:hypothetical protein